MRFGRNQLMYHQLPFQYFLYTMVDINTKNNDLAVDFGSNYRYLCEHHTQVKFHVPASYEHLPIYDLVCVWRTGLPNKQTKDKSIHTPATQEEHFIDPMNIHWNRRSWISHLWSKGGSKQ